MKDIFKIRKISLYALYSSVVLFLVGTTIASSGNNVIGIILFGLGILLFVSFVILGLLYWNCPFCHKSFELRHSRMDNVNICPFFGKRLRD